MRAEAQALQKRSLRENFFTQQIREILLPPIH